VPRPADGAVGPRQPQRSGVGRLDLFGDRIWTTQGVRETTGLTAILWLVPAGWLDTAVVGGPAPISTAAAATNLLKVGEFEERLTALETVHRQPDPSAAVFPEDPS
jgi:hypothetical protein